MIGSTFTEMNLSADLPDKSSMNNAEMEEVLRGIYGKDTTYLTDLFSKCYPNKMLLDLGYLDAMVRGATYRFLDERLRTCRAKTYAYIFTPDISYHGGVPAWHSSDMVYLFHNVDMTPIANFKGSDHVEQQYSGMWVNFAKYGDPSNDGFVEKWRPYTVEDPCVMVIDRESRMHRDYDRELVSFLDQNYKQRFKQNHQKRPKQIGI